MLNEFENMKDCFELDDRQVMLLGVSKEVLVRVFGEPSATYTYHEKEILHYGRPELSFVELTKGVVSKCETQPDCRAAFRVQPAVTINVCIMTRFDELIGVIDDLSVTGMKLSLMQHYDFMELEELFLGFDLNILGVNETITVPAIFYRMMEEDGVYKAVFLLKVYSGTDVYDKLSSFVLQRQKEMLERYRQESVSGSIDNGLP